MPVVTDVTRYRIVAILALVGLFVSAYLLLYSLGYYGMIQCGTGACEVVQTSKYAVFLGVPVSGWGAAWYAGMLGLALVMAPGRLETSRPGRLIALGATAGLAFSIYLTAIEAFVLEAWCRWCVVSAVLTVAIFLLVAPWRQLRPGTE
ncbi:MAG TPA: vitamin K epoxide reductase family protein [Gemmatimonadota bacterium]|nr:vitamin K epoxide reductase family protein [Gemmatimonadota bacterium]